jgi:hypothetical protein
VLLDWDLWIEEADRFLTPRCEQLVIYSKRMIRL